MSEPHMIKQTISFSDGTETVIEYKANENAEVIEEMVAEAVEAKEPETPVEMKSELIEEDASVDPIDEEVAVDAADIA
jgi:hypothetical protein